MVDINVMILISPYIRILIVIPLLFLGSCESLKSITGFSKPVLEEDIASETPELVLPPDFEAKPRVQSNNTYNVKNDPIISQDFSVQEQQSSKKFVLPKAQNFIARNFAMPSAKSPSDSIEKFRGNKKFSIGQWVYSQSVNKFKNENLYYSPNYDKGYNFSRRYIPDSYRNDMGYNFGNSFQRRITSDLPNQKFLSGETLITDSEEIRTIK